MERIWPMVLILCLTLSLVTGKTESTAQAILEAGKDAADLAMTLLAAMTLWNGLLEVLQETGDVHRVGRLFRRLAAPLFPGLEDESAWSAMSMNLAANLMGLGNAATPAGIEAAKRLSCLGTTGIQALAMLLVMNNAGLQLLPTTIITLRQAAGSVSPGGIWLPTMIVSSVSIAVGILLMTGVQRGGRRS